MAGFAVNDPQKVSLTLLTRTVPAAKYAVFAVPGSIKGLGDAYKFIYGTWLPKSGYAAAYPFDLERYDITPAAVKAGTMPVEILVPVKDAK
jgi:AraC family transcriptional regulator